MAFQPSQAPAVESGVDTALPRSLQGAKSGAETRVAMNFFLSKQGCGTSLFYLEAASCRKLCSFGSQL